MRTYSINGVGKTGYSLAEEGSKIYESHTTHNSIQNGRQTNLKP